MTLDWPARKAGSQSLSQSGSKRVDDGELTVRPLMGPVGRTLNALPYRHDIVPVRAETYFGLIVGYSFHIEPREGRRCIETLRVDGV